MSSNPIQRAAEDNRPIAAPQADDKKKKKPKKKSKGGAGKPGGRH